MNGDVPPTTHWPGYQQQLLCLPTPPQDTPSSCASHTPPHNACACLSGGSMSSSASIDK
jgi:hypothetical protein